MSSFSCNILHFFLVTLQPYSQNFCFIFRCGPEYDNIYVLTIWKREKIREAIWSEWTGLSGFLGSYLWGNKLNRPSKQEQEVIITGGTIAETLTRSLLQFSSAAWNREVLLSHMDESSGSPISVIGEERWYPSSIHLQSTRHPVRRAEWCGGRHNIPVITTLVIQMSP